jgi:signal transduction histidine kinase
MTPNPATSLFDQLRDLCEQFRSEGDIACEVRIEARHTLFSPELCDVVYRTVRELLANVRQHAKAKRVDITSADRRDGQVAITVADDGIGLPPHKRRGNPLAERDGIGLWSIDQRLREFGAVLDIDAAENQGTRATIILPRGESLPSFDDSSRSNVMA